MATTDVQGAACSRLLVLGGLAFLVSFFLYAWVLEQVMDDGHDFWPVWAFFALGPLHLACWLTAWKATQRTASRRKWITATLAAAAYGAVARKLVQIIYGVQRTKTAFKTKPAA